LISGPVCPDHETVGFLAGDLDAPRLGMQQEIERFGLGVNPGGFARS
jgi:hypothetical protein